MTDFFISYAAADQAWAEWIAWILEDAKHTTKIQAWGFRPGSHFAVEIRKVSADAERIIVVLSPDYLESLDGMAEGSAAFIEDASAVEEAMFPVLVRKAGTGGLLDQKSLIDLVYLEEDGARGKLLAAVGVKPIEKAAFPGLLRQPFPGSVRERRLAAMPLDTRLCYKQVLAIQEKAHGPESLATAHSLLRLGSLLRSQGNLCSERALAIFEARLGPEHPKTQYLRKNLGALGPKSP